MCDKTELESTKTELSHAEHEFKALEPRLSFSPKLPTSVLLSILGQAGKILGERAACVKREWRDVVGTAKARWGVHPEASALCRGGAVNHGGLYSDGDNLKLGHGGTQHELVPRLVEAMVGNKPIGAAASGRRTHSGVD